MSFPLASGTLWVETFKRYLRKKGPPALMRQLALNLMETKKGLALILFLSFVLRAILMSFSSDIAIDHDGMIYIEAAKEFAHGNFMSGVAAYPLVLYPLLIAMANFLVQDWVLAARFISGASLWLILIPLYFISDHLVGRRAAFWSCLAFSLSPEPLRLSLLAIRDNPFALMFAVGVCFALLAVASRKTTHVLTAAGTFCLSIQLRIEGIIIFPAFMLFLIGLAIVKRNETPIYMQFAFIWGVICATLVLVILTAVLSDNILFSRFNFNRVLDYRVFLQDFFHQNFFANYQKIHEHLKVMEKYSPYGTASLNFAGISMSNIALIYMIGLTRGFIQLIYPLNMLALLWGFKCSRWSRCHALVLFFASIYFIMVYLFVIYKDFFDNRFLLPPAVILYPWVGMGVQQAFETVGKKGCATLLALALASAIVLPAGIKLTLLFTKPKDVIVASGEWLARQAQMRNIRLFSTDDRILFYACLNGLCLKGEDFCRNVFDIDYTCLESHVLQNKIDVIIIYDDKEDFKEPHVLNGYQKRKEFINAKKSVSVYYHLEKING
jgi:hypothetical protein